MRSAVFLDRDGVLNRNILRQNKPYPPATLEELEILPGVKEACEDLKRAGFLLVVATNQPDVVRGLLGKSSVETVNQKLLQELPLDDVRVCYHDDSDGCACRKPKPGLLLAAAKDLSIDCAASFMVGDRPKDIEAGRQAGCKTILIEYVYSQAQSCVCDYKTTSLLQASRWILSKVKI